MNTLVLATLAALATIHAASAGVIETIRTLPNFGVVSDELVKTPSSSFLGVSWLGGLGDRQAIIEIAPDGSVARLVDFPDYYNASSTLTLGTDGKYYGTSEGGLVGDKGTVFRVSAAGVFEKLADFSSILPEDEERPNSISSLKQAKDGSFYGVLGREESTQPAMVFKMTAARKLVVVARFKADDPQGGGPFGGLVEMDDGSFLGTAYSGGISGGGMIFKVTKAGVVQRFVDFAGSNGIAPNAGLVKGSDGSFYGTTTRGGLDPDDFGTIYKLTASGSFSTIAVFNGTNGKSPQGRLVEKDGTFYGATYFGGEQSKGVIFKITPGDSNSEIVKLAELTSESGVRPYTGLTFGDDGALYVPTDSKTIVRMTLDGTLSKAAQLGAPLGLTLHGIVPGPNGDLFGAALSGGTADDGTLFKLTTDGEFTKLLDFKREAGGTPSLTPLRAGLNQNLYLFTHYTNLYGERAGLKRVGADGTLTYIADFFRNVFDTDASVTETSDGDLYGIAPGERDGVRAKIFRYGPTAGTGTLREFASDAEVNPVGHLMEGSDGALYGAATPSFLNFDGYGAIFRVTKSGVYKVLARLNDETGRRARGSLVQGSDGNFYGIATQALRSDRGSVYRVSPAGELRVLAKFEGLNVAFPDAALVVGPSGKLYGTSSGGGLHDRGAIFSVSFGGKLTILDSFDGRTNGAYPNCALCVGADGKLYGTTQDTIFRLAIPNDPPVAKTDSLTLPIVRRNVLRNDIDPNHDVLSIVSVTDGAHGTVDFSPDGTVTYTLDRTYVPDFENGEFNSLIDSFTYTISDGFGSSSTATVEVLLPLNTRTRVAGVYGGTLTLHDVPRGYVEFRLAPGGTFSGVIYIDGVRTPIKGVFGFNGNCAKTIPRRAPLSPLEINFQLDPIRNRMVGIVSDDSDTYSMEVTRSLPIYSANSPTERGGRYTVLLTLAQADPALRGGSGFARMTVSKRGGVTMAGKLGDGQPFTAGSFLTSDEKISLYAPAYLGKRGYVAGSLAFSSVEDSDLSGSLSWKKPAQLGDPLYPAGFSTNVNLIGARYVNGAPVMPMRDGPLRARLMIDGSPQKEIQISTSNAVTVTSPAADGTKMKVDGKTGVFSGSYLDGSTRRAFGGVILQKGTPQGEGVSINETTTEKVRVVPSYIAP